MSTTIDDVVKSMGENLLRGEGAYFLGSGISAASGLPDWLPLIQDIARPLGIDVTNEDDLPRIAQYCVNIDKGNRGPIIGKLKRVLSRPSSRTNLYHTAISRTNLRTIWTTNFDTTLERDLAPVRLTVRANDSDLTSGTQDFDLELLKLHGCLSRSSPDEFVLTQQDYEEFAAKRPALSERLRQDLIHTSVLFVGYRYRDPNIATAMVEVRRLSGGATREHFMIAKQETDPPKQKRQMLWHDDLRRFGIRTALIADYDELTTVLQQLSLASRGKSVFITGSHTGTDTHAAKIGQLLAAVPDLIFIDGQSDGISRMASDAFGTTCVQNRIDLRGRIRYFPNPYSFNPAFATDPTLLEVLKKWRASLFRAAHSVVVFDGGMGTQAEVELALSLGCVVIPFKGSTGGLAATLLNRTEVTTSLDPNYVSAARSGTASPSDVVDCILKVFSI